MTRLSHTYWNGNGKYQEMLDEMEEARWNEIGYTTKSKSIARRYYRYFNDGDIPRGKQFSIYMPLDIIEYRLEKQANEMVLKEYARFKYSLNNK